MRGKIRELLYFLRQCCGELMSRGKGQATRNSDLRQHSFATMPESSPRPRKRFSLKKIRNRMQQKRRVQNETYETQLQRKGIRFRFLPAAVAVSAVVVIVTTGGLQKIGGLFSEISLFKVRDVDIVGCESTSDDRLRLLTGINLYQTSLLGLDTDTLAASVEQDPWVRKAVVKRNWPSKVIVEVIEYQPVAMINRSTTENPRLFYIDKSGTPFMEVSPGEDVDFPVITGLDQFVTEDERKGIFRDIYTFLKLAGRNNPNLPAQSISEIHINDDGEMVIYLVDQTFPIFFGKGQVAEKYSRLVKVLDVLYREKTKGMLISGVEYIRMDYLNDKVLVAQSESG